MGEYATYKGKQIKIGTCEDMYYLRADQARLLEVDRKHGDTDVITYAKNIRFRFPFPDEDQLEPGSFDDFHRAVFVRGVTAPEIEHYSVQFSSQAGYLCSLPCPESPEGAALPFKVHRNGFRGYVGIAQQRVFDGRLVLVAQCGGCESKWRYETLEEVRPILEACRADSGFRFMVEIAARIESGYTSPLPWEQAVTR